MFESNRNDVANIVTQAYVLTGVDLGAVGLQVTFTVLVSAASTGVDPEQRLCIDSMGDKRGSSGNG